MSSFIRSTPSVHRAPPSLRCTTAGRVAGTLVLPPHQNSGATLEFPRLQVKNNTTMEAHNENNVSMITLRRRRDYDYSSTISIPFFHYTWRLFQHSQRPLVVWKFLYITLCMCTGSHCGWKLSSGPGRMLMWSAAGWRSPMFRVGNFACHLEILLHENATEGKHDHPPD